jgi:hypothetical protein
MQEVIASDPIWLFPGILSAIQTFLSICTDHLVIDFQIINFTRPEEEIRVMRTYWYFVEGFD